MKATFISNESLGAILSERAQDLTEDSIKRKRVHALAKFTRTLVDLGLTETLEVPFWIGWGVSHLGHVGVIIVQGEATKVFASAPERIRVTDVTEEVMRGNA